MDVLFQELINDPTKNIIAILEINNTSKINVYKIISLTSTEIVKLKRKNGNNSNKFVYSIKIINQDINTDQILKLFYFLMNDFCFENMENTYHLRLELIKEILYFIINSDLKTISSIKRRFQYFTMQANKI